MEEQERRPRSGSSHADRDSAHLVARNGDGHNLALLAGGKSDRPCRQEQLGVPAWLPSIQSVSACEASSTALCSSANVKFTTRRSISWTLQTFSKAIRRRRGSSRSAPRRPR